MSQSQVLQAVVLGILQGLTEFLPISSSAHLILLPWLLGWEEMGLTFDIMLHTGTLLAILLYFRSDWKQLLRQLASLIRPKGEKRARVPLLEALLLGTLPALLAGWSLEEVIETHARTPAVTAFTLAAFGLFLWWADRRASGHRSLSGIGPLDGALVGLAQALALVPGVSRSAVTITAALLLGLGRADAARFSFLLSAPVLVLATLRGLYELLWLQVPQAGGSLPAVTGVVVSFLSGWICIHFFLRYLQSHSYLPFVLYRLVLALWILLLL